MSLPLVFSNVFESSVEEAFDWYLQRSEFAAMHFLDCLDKALQTVERNPFLFQVQQRNFRQVVLKPFPYVVIYRIRKNDVFYF
jgi:hypothetical protein